MKSYIKSKLLILSFLAITSSASAAMSQAAYKARSAIMFLAGAHALEFASNRVADHLFPTTINVGKDATILEKARATWVAFKNKSINAGWKWTINGQTTLAAILICTNKGRSLRGKVLLTVGLFGGNHMLQSKCNALIDKYIPQPPEMSFVEKLRYKAATTSNYYLGTRFKTKPEKKSTWQRIKNNSLKIANYSCKVLSSQAINAGALALAV